MGSTESPPHLSVEFVLFFTLPVQAFLGILYSVVSEKSTASCPLHHAHAAYRTADQSDAKQPNFTRAARLQVKTYFVFRAIKKLNKKKN